MVSEKKEEKKWHTAKKTDRSCDGGGSCGNDVCCSQAMQPAEKKITSVSVSIKADIEPETDFWTGDH